MDHGSTAAVAANAALPGGIVGVEYKKLGYSLFVWVSDSKLECRCSYVPRQQGSMITLDELRGYLNQSYVREGVDDEALTDFVSKAASGLSLTMVPIASGIAPVDGRDGWLVFCVTASQETQVGDADAETVDHKSVQTFINVSPGDEIAKIYPPEPGQPGRNVIGEAVPPPSVKPLNLKIGKNILLEQDGSLLVAEAAGRVCIATDEISVVEEYVVNGDVNFKVGNIVFNGMVDVRGDVLDDFSITATKGLRVSGNIGACTIRSDGDVIFCGMDGGDRGSIICGGSVTANFVHDSTIECAGNVTIDVELHNTHIKTLGKIVVNKGAICGGSYIALGGIETKKAGSLVSVKTSLRVGVDYHDIAELERMLAEIDEINAKIVQTTSVPELEELRKIKTELNECFAELKSRAPAQANPKINVKGMLYDNTFLTIGLAPRQKIAERPGPFSVVENSAEGGLQFQSMTSLNQKAAKIEVTKAYFYVDPKGN